MNLSRTSRTFGLLVCLLLSSFLAGKAPMRKVRLAVGSKPGNIVYIQIDLARALGYFTEQGLDFDFEYFEGGTPAAQALPSRKAEFSANSIAHPIHLRSEGKALTMVASFTNLPTVTLLA